jgi:hypothetical protein
VTPAFDVALPAARLSLCSERLDQDGLGAELAIAEA